MQHAGKAAELLQARFSQVLGQAGAHPPAERTVAGAISSLDELSASLQLRDQARARPSLHVEGPAARGPGMLSAAGVAGPAGAPGGRGGAPSGRGAEPAAGRRL